ncbi:hypothetical protein [Brevibacillus sp. 179-C9.3 HS]|uniref:hypothetical protein n=1 Tax=unclassified Brevibacillus TaxID=2684853 RepID=UPI0039A39028
MKAANKLMEQIKLSLLSDYKKKLEREPIGVIKFFIRDYTLQKTGVEDVIDCNDASSIEGVVEKNGLRNKSDFDLFFGLLARGLMRASDLSYGYVRVTYNVNHDIPNSEEKISMQMTFERETHYNRGYFVS